MVIKLEENPLYLLIKKERIEPNMKNILIENLLKLPGDIAELKHKLLEISKKADSAELDVKNKEINALTIVIDENRATNNKGREAEVEKILSADEEYSAFVDDMKVYRNDLRIEQINLEYMKDMLRSYQYIVELGRD